MTMSTPFTHASLPAGHEIALLQLGHFILAPLSKDHIVTGIWLGVEFYPRQVIIVAD